ncbi:MAG: GAF domain-containing sensor histidine kinase, partial [Cyanobacteria bacterium P01_E01_bin.34]
VTQDDIELAQALSNQATLAVQLTRLAEDAKQTAVLQVQEKAAQERAAELVKTNEAIARTLEALTTTPELNEFLGQILTQIVEQIGADDTHLFIYDSETHSLRSRLAVQNSTVYLGTAPGDPDIFSTDIPADITAGWQILVDESKPITLNDNNPRAAEFYWPTTVEWHSSRGHQSATCICMKIGDRPIGFIGFAFCARRILTSEQLEFIQALTNQATLAIHLTRLAEQARTNALTDERTRLAREIHDTLAQAFTGVSLQLEAVRGITSAKNGSVPSPHDFSEAQTYIRRARDLARAGLSEARRSVRALRSEALETDILPDALRKALAQTQRDTGLDTHFQLEGDPVPLPDDLELNLLRIGQEAITNTLRHARATKLDLTLHFKGDRIQLRIVDDGQGFDPVQLSTQSGFGLLGIRERTNRFYGTFDLISTPGIGTAIEVTIPLNTT